MVGRAFRDITGTPVVAETVVDRRDTSSEWRFAPLPSLAVEAGRLSAADRARAAAAWRRDAAYEHASVASFAQLALSLMMCGAPPDLLEDCHRAAIDEVRHAQHCYAIASVFGEVAVRPSALPVAGKPTPSISTLLLESFRDGCVGESVASIAADFAAADCEVANIRDVLSEVAKDEQRHAELAWRIVRWCMGHADCAALLRAELQAVEQEVAAVDGYDTDVPHVTCRGGHSDDEAARLSRHGILAPEALRAVRQQVLVGVVVPSAKAMLAQGSCNEFRQAARRHRATFGIGATARGPQSLHTTTEPTWDIRHQHAIQNRPETKDLA